MKPANNYTGTKGNDSLKESPAKKSTSPKDPQSENSQPIQEKRPRRRRPRHQKGGRQSPGNEIPAVADKEIPADGWTISLFEVEPVDGMVRFHDFDLSAPVMRAIFDLGFEYCTPIQKEILPSTLAGRDATGRAQTGTGKTAAFLITIIERFIQHPIQEKRKPGVARALIIAPTRELVLQISEEARQLSKYCDLNIVSVFGGMDYEKQRKMLHAASVDIIVATPGRLLDFNRQRDLFLKKLEVLIIDEADRMLDMGFIPDVRQIIYASSPKDQRQTLLFSATLTEEITRLSSQWTRKPVTVEIEPEQVAVDTVDQIIYIVTADKKFILLLNIIERQDLHRVLVFCNRRDEVNKLANLLTRYGINAAVLSGEIPQKKRIRRLEDFKTGKIRVLVATDVAGRGIHIEGMNHVINFTLPRDPEDYVHRIGRTGRAGSLGTSISFADEDDSFYIPAIEKYIDRGLSCIEAVDEWLNLSEEILERKKRISRREKKVAGTVQQKPRPSRRPRRKSENRAGS